MDEKNKEFNGVFSEYCNLEASQNMGPAIERTQTEFSALNNDCILEIVDWLSLTDLYAISLTCKRLQNVCNEYFKCTYKRWIVRVDKKSDNEYQLTPVEKNKYFRSYSDVLKFKEIIKNIFTPHENSNYNSNFGHLNEILSNIEHFYVFEYFDGMYENLIKKCNKIKYLKIIVRIQKNLWHQFWAASLPSLTYFEYWRIDSAENELTIQFFQRNPNIKAFSSNGSKITIEWLKETGCKFDDLIIRDKSKNVNDVNNIIDDLHLLHKSQQFKRLHLYCEERDHFLHPRFTELTYLESIGVCCFSNYLSEISNALASLTNLKVLVYYVRHMVNQESSNECSTVIAKSLVNLEEVHTYSNEFISFVRHSPKLETIYVGGFNSSWKGTLQQLDKVRRQTEGACKCTIYLEETEYLNAKHRSSTDSYGLIQIKRSNTYEKKRPFTIHLDI